MNLGEEAVGIIRDAERLKDHNRLIIEYQNYVQLKKEFDELSSKIEQTSRFVSLLGREGISVRAVPAPSDAVVTLQRLVSEDGAFSENPLADVSSALSALRNWVEGQRVAVREAYRTWVNRLFGDLDGVKAFASHVAAFDRPTSARIQRLVGEAESKRNSIPSRPDDLESARDLEEQLTAEIQSIASSDVQRGYLAALRSDGISLEDLTDDFEAWAREKHIWPSLKVKLG